MTEKERDKMTICNCINKICLIHQNEYFREIEHDAALAENKRVLDEVEKILDGLEDTSISPNQAHEKITLLRLKGIKKNV